MKPKLLAIVGSHRKDGNSYALVKAVLRRLDADFRIIQLADKKVDFCILCDKCIDEDCVLEDDVNWLLAEMRKADGIIFALPKYLDVPSKFLAFLERLNTIVHMRRHNGYSGPPQEPDYELIVDKKPFCLFALSGTGKFSKKDLRTVVEYIQNLGLNLVKHAYPPFIAVNVKAGDEKGEVLKNDTAVRQCKELAQKVIVSAKR